MFIVRFRTPQAEIPDNDIGKAIADKVPQSAPLTTVTYDDDEKSRR